MSSFLKDKKLCCGCRGCEQICPNHCIKMERDEEGFLYPRIDVKQCNKCGLCEQICPIKDGGYVYKDALPTPDVYAAYHVDEQILKSSTSGGAFTAIVQAFAGEDYVIFGAAFDDNFVVRHTFVTEKRHISKFRKSKYVQSDLGHCFREVKKFLSMGKQVLFSGTPCQIAGLKEFLHDDYENLLCVDIVCHGVPSPKVFEMYKDYLSRKCKSEIVGIDFRDKSKSGWDKPYMTVTFKNGKRLQNLGADDAFCIGFYKKYYDRPACHKCPFAQIPRVSDFTIADFWGTKEANSQFNNKGTSLILVNTQRGKAIYETVKKYLIYEQAKLEDVIKFNPQLKHPAKINPLRGNFMVDLSSGKTFSEIRKKYLKPRPLIIRFFSEILGENAKSKIKKILKW